MGSVATRPRNRNHNRNQTGPRTPAPPVGADHVAARALGAAAVTGVALIHFVDLFDKFKETPYVGLLFLGLIAGSLWAARRLVLVGDNPGWLVAGGLAAATVAGYTLSRTVGLPAATDDVGNWGEALGLASLFVEGALVLLSAEILLFSRRRPARP
jgi:hypothetical protein